MYYTYIRIYFQISFILYQIVIIVPYSKAIVVIEYYILLEYISKYQLYTCIYYNLHY